MKKIVTVTIIILSSILATCQEIFISNDTAFERQCVTWEFIGVIRVDSTIGKDVLFQKARQWFSESFVSAKAVIDNEDKAEGVIYGKGNIPMGKDVDGRVKFTIEIRCKDGKIKYIFSNFHHEGACVINVFGTCATGLGSKIIDLGPLTQDQIIPSYADSGRKKDKWWLSIRSQTKKAVFDAILSLNQSMSIKKIKDKDSW